MLNFDAVCLTTEQIPTPPHGDSHSSGLPLTNPFTLKEKKYATEVCVQSFG